MSKRIIIGISGASGAIYGVKLLQALKQHQIETHLVISRTGQITVAHETPHSLAEVQAMADVVHNVGDLSASIASGSFQTLGMVVAPCSMRSLAEIATGMTSNLLTRAADVVLKERRRLVLLPREAPLNLSHLRNMVTVTEMGGICLPPVPAFYNQPKTIDDLTDHTVGRVLDLFGLEATNLNRWEGMPARPTKS